MGAGGGDALQRPLHAGRERARRCPGSTSGRSGTSRTSGIYLAPETVNGHSSVEVAPRLYRGLVDAAWSALHATGHGSDTILIGETGAGGLELQGRSEGRLRRVRQHAAAAVPAGAVLRRRRLQAATGLGGDAARLPGRRSSGFGEVRGAASGAVQGLGLRRPPVSAGAAAEPGVTRASPTTPSWPRSRSSSGCWTGVNRLYGSSTQFPIWSTEFGYVTDPPNTAGGSVPVKTAALYLNWAEYLTWANPRIKSYDQYLINDPSTANGFTTGLKTFAGKPKVTMAAYRMPLYLPVSSTAKGHPLVVWGEVRPAPDAAAQTHRPQYVQIQFRSGSDGRLQDRAARQADQPARLFRSPPDLCRHGPGATALGLRRRGGELQPDRPGHAALTRRPQLPVPRSCYLQTMRFPTASEPVSRRHAGHAAAAIAVSLGAGAALPAAASASHIRSRSSRTTRTWSTHRRRWRSSARWAPPPSASSCLGRRSPRTPRRHRRPSTSTPPTPLPTRAPGGRRTTRSTGRPSSTA